MTTIADLPALREAAGAELKWSKSLPLPGSEDRLIALGERSISFASLMKASLRIAARSFGAFTINSTPAPWPACQSTNFFRDALADRNLVPDRKEAKSGNH